MNAENENANAASGGGGGTQYLAETLLVRLAELEAKISSLEAQVALAQGGGGAMQGAATQPGAPSGFPVLDSELENPKTKSLEWDENGALKLWNFPKAAVGDTISIDEEGLVADDTGADAGILVWKKGKQGVAHVGYASTVEIDGFGGDAISKTVHCIESVGSQAVQDDDGNTTSYNLVIRCGEAKFKRGALVEYKAGAKTFTVAGSVCVEDD